MMRRRLAALERRYPEPAAPLHAGLDLSRLTDAELDELEGYSRRAAGATTVADLMRRFTAEERERVAALLRKATPDGDRRDAWD